MTGGSAGGGGGSGSTGGGGVCHSLSPTHIPRGVSCRVGGGYM